MFKFVRRVLCTHSFSWSERRKGDVCVRCGRFREDQKASIEKALSGGH